MIIHYRKDLKQKANNLRTESTKSERILWSQLRRKQVLGFKFIRQKPIDKYIVDFYCKELKLAVEVDGLTHDETKFDYDERRTKEIEEFGIKLLRFSAEKVLNDVEEVIQTIVNWIEDPTSIEEKSHP